MIEKILGVVCIVAAGAMYTAEFVVWKASEHWLGDTEPRFNGFVLFLTVLGICFLIGGYFECALKSVGRANEPGSDSP